MTSSLTAARRALMRLLEKEEGFVGVGSDATADGAALLIVHVTSADAPVCSKIPSKLDDVPVVTKVVGKPRKF